MIGETAGGKDQTGGHGDNDVAGDALETALDDGEHQVQDQEVAPVESTGGGVGGHGSGITEQPQGAQRQVGDDAAHGTDDHGLLLAQTGGQQRDGQEGGNAGGDGGQSRDVALQQGRTGNAGEHGDVDSAGLGRGSQLVGRGRQNQHLNGAVVLKGIPVVLEADLDGFAGSEELAAVLGGNSDDSQHGAHTGSNGSEQPHGVEELGRGVAAHAFVRSSQVGSHNGQTGKEDRVVHSVEGDKQGALFRVIGQAALGRLGNNTLAGVAQVVHTGNHDEEDEAGTFRQQVGNMEHDEAGHGQNHVAQDHEGAVFAETAVGLVNHVADERVGNTVPDTHDHREAGRHDHGRRPRSPSGSS